MERRGGSTTYSLWNDKRLDEMRGRLAAFWPEAPALWGTLTPHVAVCHLADSFRMALGEVTGPPVGSALRYPPMKWLAIYVLPMPKGVKGPAEYFTTAPTSWDGDRAELQALVDRCALRAADAEWGVNPFFGSLSKRQWGFLLYKHMDYHLRQFGC